jgi:anti-sigma factor RsiW
MDHAEAREALELAAIEPGGLDRLMAGDTARAAAVVGHLAGCDACATELERLRRATPLLRDVVRTTPPEDLRERTLAFVRERGTPRSPAAAARVAPAAPAARAPEEGRAVPVSLPGPMPATLATRGPSPLPWLAAIAAAVVLSVVATNLLLGARLEGQARAIAGLEAVTAATIAVTSEDDVRRVALTGGPEGDATGSLLFSPSTTELVVVARGLERPPAGQEFRCWLAIDGQRQVVGRMFFADELAYWVGDTPAVADLPGDVSFGVSLVDLDDGSLEADPVVLGEL